MNVLSPFSINFKTDYISIRSDFTVSFSRLMEYIQECGLAHTESTPHPMLWFYKNQQGWLVTNWQVEINKYPRFGEKIRVETWPSKFKGVMGERNFVVYNSLNECILKSFSNWIYTDLEKRKPIRPEKNITDGYGKLYPQVMKKDFKIPSLDLFDFVDDYSFKVMRNDTDTNNHVNNIKYIEWLENGIPDNIYQNYDIKNMKIVYRKECSCYDHITVQTYKNNFNEFLTIINKTDDSNNIITLCEAYTKWETKK